MSRRGTWLLEGALRGASATLVAAMHLGGAIWVHSHARPPPLRVCPIRSSSNWRPCPQPPHQWTRSSKRSRKAQPEPQPEPEPEPEPEPGKRQITELPLPELAPLPDMNSLFPPPPDAVVLQKSVRPQGAPRTAQGRSPRPRANRAKSSPSRKSARKKKAEAQPSRKATTELKAPKGERTAAPQAQAGAPSKKQVAGWQSKVNATVARHMKRARPTLGALVTVNIRFSIDASGRVSGAGLAGSTGNAKNDAVLNRQAASLPRLPAPPSGRSTTLPCR